MATHPKQFVTLEEYFEQERTAMERHEYLNGEVVVMAGGTEAHSIIGLNIGGELRALLKGRNCKVYNSEMRIRTLPLGLYNYVDAAVSCGGSHVENDTLLNPIVIVEVLSKSNASYDRGEKFELYRQISSFREYLIVAQDRPYVEHHVREDRDRKVWTLREYTSLEDIVILGAIDVKLHLADIYTQISFPATVQ